MPSPSPERTGLKWLRRLHPPAATRGTSRLARGLLRRGEAAAALWWGSGDGVVLSALGLHLSAQPLLEAMPGTDPAQSLAGLRTAIALGQADMAVQAARGLLAGDRRRRAACERLLVGLQDPRVPPLLTPGSVARAAAWLALGDARQALDELAGHRGDGEAGGSVDALAVCASAWRRLGRHDEAQAALSGLCRLQSLRPVGFDGAGIGGLRCETRPSRSGPLVSVVMPVRNVAGHFAAALGSVQAQDHTRLEILVVDDASDDGTAELAQALASRDARVTVVRRASRGGAYRARNDGLALARGEIVTFHDGDDWSHPEKITRQLQALEQHPGAVACLSDWIRLLDDGSFTARQVFPLARQNMSSLMLRRPLAWSGTGCFDPVLAGADSEYPARLRLRFGRDAVVRVRQVLSFASTRQDSLMHDPATGYASDPGRRQRLAYWEAWNRWHADVFGAGDLGALRLGPEARPFPVPECLSQAPAGSLAPEGLPRLAPAGPGSR